MMDLRNTFSALRTGWHLIIVAVLVAAGVAVWMDRTAVPMYSASASYVVAPGAAISADDVARGVDTLDSSRSRSIMTTLTEITDSDAVRDEVVAALGLDAAIVDTYSIDSVVVPEANVMRTTVTGSDPELAAELASGLGEAGAARFVALYRIYDVGVLDPATPPSTPSNPGLPQLLVLAGAMGVMVGGALALLRWAWLERSGRTVHSRLGAYGPKVTSIQENARFKRVG